MGLTLELVRDMSMLLIETDDTEYSIDDEVQSLGAGPRLVSVRRTFGVGAPKL